MQSHRVIAGVLAGLVAMPASFVGHAIRVGDHTQALKLLPAVLAVIVICAAIMQPRRDS
jgi:hypothetical protein